MDYPVEELVKFDIVITTQSFLRQRYLDHDNYETFITSANAFSPREAEAAFEGGVERIHMPLHSSLYRRMNKNIAVLIVDESQDAKNPRSILLAALRSLNPAVAFLLTGTPVHNKWEDLYGQMSILPGCPFKRVEDFKVAFGTPNPSQSGAVDHLDEPRMLLLKKLMAGMLVARPKSCLSLPNMEEKLVEVGLSWEQFPREMLAISKAVAAANRCLARSRAKPHKRQKFLRRAFGAFSEAQSLSANPLLLWRGDESLKNTLTTVTESFHSFLRERNMSTLYEMTDLDGHLWDLFKSSFLNTTAQRHKTAGRTDKDRGVHHDDSHTVDPVEAYGTNPEDFTDMDKLTYAEENFRYAEDEMDGSYNPEESETEDNCDGGNTEGSSDSEDFGIANPRRFHGRSNATFAQKWVHHLTIQPDDTVFSPRVKVIIATIRSIRTLHVGEKIMIISRSIMFLDIILEALERRAKADDLFQFGSTHFNGTINSSSRRASILGDFNNPHKEPTVLLCSIGAGGAGLNITGASHLIICEPLWSPGQVEQAIGRVYRMPQKRNVIIYHVVASESDIDRQMRSACQRKRQVEANLIQPLVRDDREPFISRLPTRSDLVQNP